MNLKEQKIDVFLTDLSSKRPIPGGGAVAGLAGAIAAALVVKVARLTIGKKGYEKNWTKLETILNQAQQLREKLVGLAQEDAQAYEQVIEAYRTRDKKRIMAALQKAINVPKEIAKRSKQILKLARLTLMLGNKNATSDTKVAIFLSQAAISGANENIKINLKELKKRKDRS